MKKRHAITLLEIMIVIFLIGLIGGVVGYNMKGSLDRGRSFKTDQQASRIAEVLELEMNTQRLEPKQIEEDPKTTLVNSGLFKGEKEDLLKDGWGQEMVVKWNKKDAKFDVVSERNETYKQKHKTNPKG